MKAFLTVAALTIALTALVSGSAKAQALTISTPGVYSLNRNITVASGDAIVITASNVVLDLAGHSITTTAPATGRGVFVNGVKGVTVKNGIIGPFNMNVQLLNSENVTVEKLKIVGNGLAPNGGPIEMGIVLFDTRGSRISDNQITAENVGIFIRGGGSIGNRTENNQVVGGPTAANNILGMCWNPLPGGNGADSTMVPKGEFAYNNHVTGYTDCISFAAGSKGNVLRDNVLQYFGRAFRPDTLITGNNVVDASNLTIQLTP